MWCFALTSHTGAWARPTRTRNKPWVTVVFGQIFFGQVVLALACGTVDHRNTVRFGATANATTEAAGHPHQVGVLQRVVGPGQRPPPYTESAGIMPHPEIGVQDDAIHAIVAAA